MLCLVSIQSPTVGEKKSDVDRRSCCNTQQQQGGGIAFNPFFLSPPLPRSFAGAGRNLRQSIKRRIARILRSFGVALCQDDRRAKSTHTSAPCIKDGRSVTNDFSLGDGACNCRSNSYLPAPSVLFFYKSSMRNEIRGDWRRVRGSSNRVLNISRGI